MTDEQHLQWFWDSLRSHDSGVILQEHLYGDYDGARQVGEQLDMTPSGLMNWVDNLSHLEPGSISSWEALSDAIRNEHSRQSQEGRE